MYEISADESKWLNYESNFDFTHIFIVMKPFDVLFETNKDLHCSFIFIKPRSKMQQESKPKFKVKLPLSSSLQNRILFDRSTDINIEVEQKRKYFLF